MTWMLVRTGVTPSVASSLRFGLRKGATSSSRDCRSSMAACCSWPKSTDRERSSTTTVLPTFTAFAGTSRLSQTRSFSSRGSKKDFYDVLGVDRGANKAAIKKAYFKLAKKHHPDTNQNDDAAADKFKEATEAYEVLSDKQQRDLYNQFGHAGVDPNFQQGGGGGNPFGGGGPGGFNFQDGSFHFSNGGGGPELDPDDLFDMFFGGGGGGRRNRGPRRGADLQMHVRLTFEEAVFGAKKDLNLRYQHANHKTGEHSIKERDVEVTTPPGIDNGMNLRLAGQGAEGDPGAAAGNLLVQVIVDPHDYFQRDGADVHTEVPISFVEAILGGTVDVRTLTGTVEMKIPKGTQPETKLMLRGKGIRDVHGSGIGNQIVHLGIVIPKEISPRQEELLREFEEEGEKKDTMGGIGEAVGSAFDRLFGSKDKKEGGEEEDYASKLPDDDVKSNDEEEEKKQAAS